MEAKRICSSCGETRVFETFTYICDECAGVWNVLATGRRSCKCDSPDPVACQCKRQCQCHQVAAVKRQHVRND